MTPERASRQDSLASRERSRRAARERAERDTLLIATIVVVVAGLLVIGLIAGRRFLRDSTDDDWPLDDEEQPEQ